jgi:uncharacterized protein (DUF427 family)
MAGRRDRTDLTDETAAPDDGRDIKGIKPMADHIKITPADGTWIVRAGGAVLGETKRALELREGSYPPRIYVPREDMAMSLLQRSSRTSTCPWKGEASYYSISTPEATLTDAVWSYEVPKAGVEAIAGHLAFYPDKVTIERV